MKWIAAAAVMAASSPAFAEQDETGLRISSTPEGAVASVNGIRVGRTPTKVNAAPGRHEVVLELDGLREELTLRVREGEVTEVDHDFEPALEARVAEAEGYDAEGEDEPGGEGVRRFGGDDAGGGDGEVEEEPDEQSWARRINRWPMVDLQLIGAPLERTFRVAIDPNVDRANRELAHLETGFFGVLGFHVGLYPFCRFEAQAIRGLGIEGSGAFGLGLELANLNGERGPVDASYYEIDINLIYRLVLGRLDLGAELMFRVGWQRLAFQVSEDNNDLIAPVTYDGLRVDLGVRVPLRTRFMLGELRGVYHYVPSVGDQAAAAYGDRTADPVVHGAALHIGLVWRIGGLEISVTYIGRIIWSRYPGVGDGWGVDPSDPPQPDQVTTRLNGIQLLETARDSIQQIRVGFGYRW